MKLDKIIGIYNVNNKKILNLFGIKICIKKIKKDFCKQYEEIEKQYFENNHIKGKDSIAKINHIRNIVIAQNLHKDTFANYKNKYNEKSVILVATGPTLKYFTPIDNAILVGVNKAICYSRINLDYLFMLDYGAVKNYIEEAEKYPQIEKFYGYYNMIHGAQMVIPESIRIRHKANGFITYPYWNENKDIRYGFEPDISNYPIHCQTTTAIAAMQFIFYTNPSKIYLVGCDSSAIGHFDSKEVNEYDKIVFKNIQNEWKKIKFIQECYYPETKIISVNPIGLRGLFKDVYTKEFLENVPEIKKQLGDDIDIINK